MSGLSTNNLEEIISKLTSKIGVCDKMQKKIKTRIGILALIFILSYLTLFCQNVIHYSNNTHSLANYPSPPSQSILKHSLPEETTHLHPGNYENLTRAVHRMNINIQENVQDIQINSHYTYKNTGNQSAYYISIVLDIKISTVLVYDAIGDLSFEWHSMEYSNLINITLRDPLVPDSPPYTFTVSYIVEDAIDQIVTPTQSYNFYWSMEHDERTDRFLLVIALPINFVLCNETVNPPLEPTADRIFSDGQRIKFEWDYTDIPANQFQTWTVRFKTYQTILPTTITTTDYHWEIIIPMFFAGLIIGGLTSFFILNRFSATERKGIVESLLSKPEKQILKIIQEADGRITQNKICTISGFSKAKVSYYLSELEEKKIIERERWGRMNRVKIIDSALEKVEIEINDEQREEDTEGEG
ncbi:MAG: winged helix-turn-helix transcriptional regulator [Candidatus Heimdallarchaeota archaeon]|nr:winged helix-turn-helix transcriptional regulator [Candidatus Heimdallarchaeota archaeon]